MKKSFCAAWLFFSFSLLVVYAEKPGVTSLIQVSTPSGAYAKDQILSFSFSPNSELELAFTDGGKEVYIPYISPITLSALPGEEREYRIKARLTTSGSVSSERDFTYTIDKKTPLPPQLKTTPGRYSSPIDIEFQPSADSILYSINEPISRKGKLWDGRALRLSSESELERFEVFAYTLDRAGNASATKRWLFTLERKSRTESFIEILSPVPGSFANKQFLYLSSEGYNWIKYSLSGEDPVSKGELYTEPVLIEKTGNVILSVAAEPLGGGSPLRKQVAFTVQEGPAFPVKSGILTEGFRIELPGQRGFYTLNEKKPASSDPVFSAPISIEKIPGGIKYLPFRFKPEGRAQANDPEYRYYFILDARKPSEPVIDIVDEGPISSPVELSISGPSYGKIYYTRDGSTPDKYGIPYTAPLTLDLPAKSTSGSILIQAVSVAPNGLSSTVASRLIYYDREPPSAPVVSTKQSGSEVIIGCTSEQETEIVYEMTRDGSVPQVPGRDSPRIQNRAVLSIPFGMEASFKLRFASIDRAGNVSAPTEAVTVTMDRLPPKEPAIKFEGDRLTMEGEGDILFSMTDDGTVPPVPDLDSKRYTEPQSLSGRENQYVTYRYAAITRDSAGNTSGRVTYASYAVDRRVATLPSITGVKHQGLYNSAVTLHLEKPVQDTEVFYTLTTDGTEPPEPGESSSLLSSDIVFQGVEGEETVYTVKLLPMIRSSRARGSSASYRFTVDKKPPQLPVLTGFEPDAVYNTPVRLSASVPEGVRFFIAYSTDQDKLPNPFGEGGYLFQSSFTLDADKGEEKTFTILTGAYDPAGNKTLQSKPLRLTIDKKNPDPPVFAGIPEGGRTNGAVILSFAGAAAQEAGNSVYYTLAEGNALPELPTKKSALYEKPILLQGEDGKESVYTLRAIAFDRAGNSSSDFSSVQFVIDRLAPDKPVRPVINPLRQKNSLIVSWSQPAEAELYYSVGEGGEFKKYTAPIEVAAKNGENVHLSYYASDDAGNRSGIEVMEFDLVSLSENFVSGAASGTVTNKAVTFSSLASAGVVRYEVSTTGKDPSPVTQFSSLLGKGVSFDAVYGETIKFSVRFRLFENEQDAGGGTEKAVSFTIDKTPPEPPELSGIEDGAFYQDDRVLSFTSSEGEIFYFVSYTDTGEPVFDKDFTRYANQVRIGSREGEFNAYTVSAYTVDKAGNKSNVTRRWKIAIDKKIIYVNSSSGNDFYEGTRTRPFKTIEQALKHSEKTGRKTLYLSEGDYEAQSTITLPEGIVLSGGYNSSWQRTSGKSVITALMDGLPLVFSSKGGGIDGLSLRSGASGGAIVRITGGEFTISSSSLSSASGNPCVELSGGSVLIRDSEIRSEGKSQEPAVKIFSGRAEIEKTAVGHEGAGHRVVLLSVDQGELVLRKSALSPGSGEETAAIEAKQGTVNIEDTTVRTGEGSLSATGIQLKEAVLFAKNIEVRGDKRARISTLIFADSSTLDAEYSSFDLAGDRGAAGLVTIGGIADLLSCTFSSAATREFLYLARFAGTVVRMVNNRMTGGQSLDYLGLFVRGGSLLFAHNTLVNGEGEKRSIGLSLEATDISRLLNNIITQKPFERGVAVSLKNVKGAELASNIIAGPKVLLADGEKTYASIEEVNASDGDPLRGRISNNLSEPMTNTFGDEKKLDRLRPDSLAVNGGAELSGVSGTETDYAKKRRPNPSSGVRPLPDIGADELYN